MPGACDEAVSQCQHSGMRTCGDEHGEADTAGAEHSAGRPQALPHTDREALKPQGLLCLGSLLKGSSSRCYSLSEWQLNYFKDPDV